MESLKKKTGLDATLLACPQLYQPATEKTKIFNQMAKFTNIDLYQCHGHCSVFIHRHVWGDNWNYLAFMTDVVYAQLADNSLLAQNLPTQARIFFH